MPTYTYFCGSCDDSWTETNKIAERDMPLEEACPFCEVSGHITRPIETPGTVSGIQGITHHMPSDFRYLMKRIKKANYRSSLPDL